MHQFSTLPGQMNKNGVASCIDVKKGLFTFFYILVTFLMFFILSTLFIFKKRWQNRRVSKRKNGKEIIQFNNIIHFQVLHSTDIFLVF